jgi:hypothetical protein
MKTIGILMLAVGMIASPAAAQVPAPGASGQNAVLLKLFGDATAFTAQAEVRLLDKSRKETIRMAMGFDMLNGKVRTDIDMSRLQSAEFPAEALANMRVLGMDKMVSIVRPDLKATLSLYPALRAYAAIPMSKEDV